MKNPESQTGEVVDVIVIVDPDYGDRIEAAARIAPVWAIDTVANSAERKHRESVTLFQATGQDDRLRILVAILPTVELHHGKILDNDGCVSLPSGSVVGVLGLAPTKAVASALAELGFAIVGELPGGFKARKQGGAG